MSGTGGKFEFGKQGGGNWTYNAGVIWRSPELELNDIGFLRQADLIKQYLNLRYRILKPVGPFREVRTSVGQFTTFDFEGNYNRIQYTFNSDWVFRSNWRIDFGLGHKPRIFSNTELRGGPRWRFNEENYVYTFFGTNDRKKLRSRMGFVYSRAANNHFKFLRLEAGITYEPNNSIRLSIEPELADNFNQTQYVTETNFNGDPRFIMSTIDNESLSASVRFNYTLNPNLSIQYYGQPFISRVRYREFKYVTNPVARNLSDRFSVYGPDNIRLDGNTFVVDENGDGTDDYTFAKPDFSFVQFRSNLVLRWEYIPGSEIFLVWSQGITGLVDTALSLTRGLDRGIWDQQPENIFLIKATYRLVL